MFQTVPEGSRRFQKVPEGYRRLQKVTESKSQGHIVMQGTFRLCAFLRVEIGMHKDRTLQYDLINHYEGM